MNNHIPKLEPFLHALEEIQASDIKTLDVRQQTTITDYMIICNGRSSRHVKAIAEVLMEQMKAAGYPVLHKTGIEGGDWALLDFGDCIIHVMQADSRAYYNLEGLWSNQPPSS